MENITLEDNGKIATIKLKGAELTSFIKEGIEYIWDANPSVWNRHSPVLFPIVGRLKDNRFLFNDKSHTLPQHGFARDLNFQLIEHHDTKATFELTSDQKTFVSFPFEFVLRISYVLSDSRLSVNYEVENPSLENNLFFSIGAHPGFHCPLIPEVEKFTDYVLDFGDNSLQSIELWKLDEGLIANEKETIPLKNGQIPLKYALFENDALIFSTEKVKKLNLRSRVSGKGVSMDFPEFRWVGVWTKGQGAPFICLEPWCGIADTVDHDQYFTKKLGINRLSPQQKFSRSFVIQFD